MSMYKYWFDKHGYRETLGEHNKYEQKLNPDDKYLILQDEKFDKGIL